MNFSITINGEGPELANALKTLREVMDGKQIGEGSVTTAIQQTPFTTSYPTTGQAPATPNVQTTSYEQAANAYQANQPYTAPVTQPPVQQQFAQPPTGIVPTSAPSYSMEQLGVAAGPLVDSGRGPELTGWLNQHGASALTQLDKSHYGEFANYLRSLGAKI